MLWTNKSFRHLERGLLERGYTVCHRIVGEMPRKPGYGLQADKKTLTVRPSPVDRDGQFEHMNGEAKKAVDEGNPVISSDTKKKEPIGNFKNAGSTVQPYKTPVEVLDLRFSPKRTRESNPLRRV